MKTAHTLLVHFAAEACIFYVGLVNEQKICQLLFNKNTQFILQLSFIYLQLPCGSHHELLDVIKSMTATWNKVVPTRARLPLLQRNEELHLQSEKMLLMSINVTEQLWKQPSAACESAASNTGF